MHGTDLDYEEAVRASKIHSYERSREKKSISKPLFSFATLLLLGFSIYYYQKNNEVEKIPKILAQTVVLGVEKTSNVEADVIKSSKVASNAIKLPQSIQTKDKNIITEEVESQNDDYMLALEKMEVDLLVETDSKKYIQDKPAVELKDLSQELKQFVDESNIDNSNYEQDIAEEIKIDSGTQKKIVIVQKGDTLASIAEEYYGDKAYYRKIIASNSLAFDTADLIYVGQEITLP